MSICISPLEQFEIISFFYFPVLDVYFSNIALFCFFSLFFPLIIYHLIYFESSQGYFIPNFFQYGSEFLYSFILNLVYENIGKRGLKFFPFFFYLFIFLLFGNILGLIPYSFTITAQLVLAFTLSFIVWLGKLFLGFSSHGLMFFSILLPPGVPIFIVPFFVFVELLSFFIPLIALGVRLFANMMSGHILLKVIVGFSYSIILAGSPLLFICHFFLIGVLFILFFLETAVAFIQAYIFVILSCLYTGDTLKGGH